MHMSHARGERTERPVEIHRSVGGEDPHAFALQRGRVGVVEPPMEHRGHGAGEERFGAPWLDSIADVDLVVEFLRHNTRMNRRLLDACRGLPADRLDATTPGTYGSIGATLVHVANAQLAYAVRFHELDRPDYLAEDPFPGFGALDERFAHGDDLLERAAAEVGRGHEVQVRGDDPPGIWRIPAALLLLQAVNHGTEHRSQAATILTQIGVEPSEMDGWTYFFDSGQMTPV